MVVVLNYLTTKMHSLIQVEKYEIENDGEKYFVDPKVLHDGKLELKLRSNEKSKKLEEKSKFSARLKYFGFQNWTTWLRPEAPQTGSALYLSQNIVTLLPVILTSSAAIILILSLLTVCIVKKKRSQLKYDAEVRKVEEHCQDIQKHLNDKYFI